MKALIVEDDPQIMDTIADVMVSLGHEYHWVSNVEDARKALVGDVFGYVLLDMQIPARPGRGGAEFEYGLRLLEEIQVIKGRRQQPVIVMTGQHSEALSVASRLLETGAYECLAKPFGQGEKSLAATIQRVLAKAPKVRGDVTFVEGELRPFSGSELVVTKDRIELCGQVVVSGRRCRNIWPILTALMVKRPDGSYRAYSGAELAELAKIDTGQNGVASSVRAFRQRVAEVLRDKLGLACDDQSVIMSGDGGYRFNPWIVVRDLRGGAKPTVDGPPASRDGDKEEQILKILERQPLRAPEITKLLGCSASTTKRVLDNLRDQNRIRFDGPNKTGKYKLLA